MDDDVVPDARPQIASLERLHEHLIVVPVR
jgi:hypothetical protein